MGNTCILTFSGTGPLEPPFNGTYLCWNGPYMKSRLYQRCHYCIIVAILAEYFRLLHHGVEVGRSEDLVTTVTFEAPFVHRFPICHHITFLAVKSPFKYLHICKTITWIFVLYKLDIFVKGGSLIATASCYLWKTGNRHHFYQQQAISTLLISYSVKSQNTWTFTYAHKHILPV